MLRIRYVSDLHLEHCDYRVPPMTHDATSILVLAGDVMPLEMELSRVDEFLESVAAQFMFVLHVPGNHEFYGGFLTTSVDAYRKRLADKGLFNIIVLDNETWDFNGVRFIGSTLWSRPKDSIVKHMVNGALHDFGSQIRTTKDGGTITMDDTIKLFNENVTFIRNETDLAKADTDLRAHIVITHHAPSFLSVMPRWAGSLINGGFATDIDDVVRDSGAAFWFHGHMHDTFTYNIGDTTVVCNPRGYAKVLHTDWKTFVDGSVIYDDNDIDTAYAMVKFKDCFAMENMRFAPLSVVEV